MRASSLTYNRNGERKKFFVWLELCNEIKILDNYRKFEYRIHYALKNAMNKQIGPTARRN